MPANSVAFVNDVLEQSFNISVISKIETLGYNYPDAHRKHFNNFLANAVVFPLDNAIIDKTIMKFLNRNTANSKKYVFVNPTNIQNIM